MFEEMTFENILSQMLENVQGDVDKREGSIIYDALAPVAMESAQMYSDMDILLQECFADSASYYYLIKRAAERGIFVKEGIPAVIKVKCTPSDVSIPEATEFSIGEMTYSITENLGDGFYSMTCSESGENGNNINDDVIPIEYVEDLEEIEAVEVIVYGTEDEDEESLRERYFESFREAAFGGNKADYKEKAKDIEKVGACKVYPVWNGGGTVKLAILDSQYDEASSEIINEVQNEFDPTQDGTGVGIAPIGQNVTVSTPKGKRINVDVQIEYMADYTWDDIKETFTENLAEYLKNVIKNEWEAKDTMTVRSGQIESMLLDMEGVDNVLSVKIDGKTGNCIIDCDYIPKVGEISG